MIYFIQQGKAGPIKIGYTKNDINKRMDQLQTGCAYKLTLLGIIDGDKEQEYLIQKFFHGHRMYGEWFAPAPAILDYIFSLILGKPINTVDGYQAGLGLETILDNQERVLILAALEQSGQIKTAAAKLLQISLRSLRYRIERLDIE